jgi:hypothetical protein
MTIFNLIRPLTASTLCMLLLLQWSVQFVHAVTEHADAEAHHCDSEDKEKHIHDVDADHAACTFCEANFSTPLDFQLVECWHIQPQSIEYGSLVSRPEPLLLTDASAHPALRGPPSL